MSWAALIEAAQAVRAAAAEREPDVAGLRLAAIGWSTVDHERAERELDSLFASEAEWAELRRDPVLGSRAWLRGGSAAADGPALVVLEPDTEGRLAASLARFGEGVAVIYLGDGPPAPGTLVRGGPRWGPHAIVLDPVVEGGP
jgi:hypothetical protein